MRNTQRLLVLLLCLLGTLNDAILLGQKVQLEREIEADSLVLYITNNSYLPVYVKCNLNAKVPADSRMNSDFVLAPEGEREKLLVIPIVNAADTTELLQESFGKVSLKFGDPFSVEPATNFQYGLPFRRKKAYRLIQGFKGAFSHNEPSSMFALDFAMPIGEEICAARAGRVVWVKEGSKEGGPSAKYKGKDNHVIVLHDDGTLGYYVHLKYQGVLVEEGQYIDQGDLLGLSGNTGYSTRPHLHFVIRKPTVDGPVSIPFRFIEYNYQQLKEGRMIRRRR
ncbi:MAG: M23 family metallopeptidase [Saprospiraceae bacterium]|nr:M23 family metallopeptidase [Saprospiraceae bacterium]